MKHFILVLVVALSLSASTYHCEAFKSKSDYYKKLEQSKSYTGDFSDVIEQYENMYEDCLENPKKYEEKKYL